MSASLNDLQSLDLDDLDDDLLQIEKDFDLTAFSNATSINGNNETPTLESILNEDDDEEADEVLKSLSSTLTTMERLVSTSVQETENSSRRDSHEQKVSIADNKLTKPNAHRTKWNCVQTSHAQTNIQSSCGCH